MQVKDKIVIITGASGGIGLATARLFAQQGAKVALVARSADKLEQIAAELAGSFAVPFDMRNTGAIATMVEQVSDHYGRVDVLVNNAGQGMHVPIEKADLDLYRSVFELNVVAVLAAMQAVIPVMREQGGGVIVNISSGTSKMVLPGVGPYSSTKYALNAITLTGRAELAPDNIRVGVVYSGVVATEFHNNLAAGGFSGRGGSPMQAATAEEVAADVLQAVESEEAETYTANLRAMMQK